MEEESEEVELMEVSTRSDAIRQWLAKLSFPELINVSLGDGIPQTLEDRIYAFMESKGFTMPKYNWTRLVRDVAATKDADYAQRLLVVRAANNAAKQAEEAAKRAREERDFLEKRFPPGAVRTSVKSKAPAALAKPKKPALVFEGVDDEVTTVVCGGQTLDVTSLSIDDLHRFSDILQALGYQTSTLASIKHYRKMVGAVYKASRAIINLRALMPK